MHLSSVVAMIERLRGIEVRIASHTNPAHRLHLGRSLHTVTLDKLPSIVRRGRMTPQPLLKQLIAVTALKRHVVEAPIGDGHVAVPASAVWLVVDRKLRLLWAAGVVPWGDVSEAA